MTTSRCGIAAILLLAGVCIADAAPNIPSSELPGRERERFKESPVERFMQPTPQSTKPLIEWDCRMPRRSKQRSARRKNC